MLLSSFAVDPKSGSPNRASARYATRRIIGKKAALSRTAETPDATAAFEALRSRLFSIAFRILGHRAEAEDVVQDVWIRWHGVDQAEVRDRVAFLVTVTTRAALNVAASAHARREISYGAGLPERDVSACDPASRAESREALMFAVHLMMERLSPVERAVYMLREAFEYPFRDIAEVLHLSEANARQLAGRARKHLAERRDTPVDPAQRDGLLEAFVDAARAGEMARLIGQLTHCLRTAA